MGKQRRKVQGLPSLPFVPLRPVYAKEVPTACQPDCPVQASYQQPFPGLPLPRPREQHREVSKAETVNCARVRARACLRLPAGPGQSHPETRGFWPPSRAHPHPGHLWGWDTPLVCPPSASLSGGHCVPVSPSSLNPLPRAKGLGQSSFHSLKKSLMKQQEGGEKSHLSELLRAYCWSGIRHSWSHGAVPGAAQALDPKGPRAPRTEEPKGHCLHTHCAPGTSTSVTHPTLSRLLRRVSLHPLHK